MTARKRAHWLFGALALAFVQCAGDQQAAVAESPMPPPAEPPAEMTAAKPAASTAAQPKDQPAPGEVANEKKAKDEEQGR